MSSLKAKFAILAAGLMLTGCMQAATYEATNTANFKPRDKEYLAKISYVNSPVPQIFRRAMHDRATIGGDTLFERGARCAERLR